MQTATNPQTGERVQWNGSAWVPAGQAAPAQPGVVTVGQPRPAKPEVRQVGSQLGVVDPNTGAFTPTYTAPEKPSGDGEPKTTEGQKTNAGYFSRALNAHKLYGKGVAPRGALTQTLVDVAPQNFVDANKDPERKAADDYAQEFIRAKLRRESGATISPEEMAAEFRLYFPVPGDEEADIARKAALREQVIEGLRVSAGDEAGNVQVLGGPQGLTDEQAMQGLEERIKRGESPAATIKWLIDSGRPPSEEEIARIVANAGNRNPVVRGPDAGTEYGRRLMMGVGDVVEGAGDVLGLVGNPANAGINALLGTNLTTDMGQTFRDATGLPAPQTDSERMASKINVGGMSGLGLAGAGRAAAPLASGAIGYGLSRFGASPLTDMAAGASGAGSGELARQSGAGPAGQAAATLAGGGVAALGGGRVNALAMRPDQAPPNALVNAGRAEGVSVNRAMVDPSVQNRVTGVEATMGGGPIVQREMGKVRGQIEAGVQRLGQGGSALEADVAGQTVQRSADRFIKTSGQQAKRNYDRAEQIAGDTKVAPTQSLGVVDSVIAKLSETSETNAGEIAFLQKLRSDFQKDLSVGALRRVRTSLRKKISKGELTFGEDEATVLSVMDAASTDIEAGLRAAGKGAAAKAFKQADADYRERMEFITGTVQKLVGRRNANLPPRRVFDNLKAMASPKGDDAGLARMMRVMDPEERADIAATFADALGKNGKGEFSTAFLLSQAEKLPKAARVNLFGREGAESLDNLLALAKEHNRVSSGLNNSRTGVANDWRSYLHSTIFGGGTGIGTGLLTESGMTAAVVGVGTAAATAGIKAGRDALSAKALMSPDIAKWLRSAPRTTDGKAIDNHMSRLKAIASKQPALQSDIQSLQQLLLRVANENASNSVRSVAAGRDDRESDQEQRQPR